MDFVEQELKLDIYEKFKIHFKIIHSKRLQVFDLLFWYYASMVLIHAFCLENFMRCICCLTSSCEVKPITQLVKPTLQKLLDQRQVSSKADQIFFIKKFSFEKISPDLVCC